jgi:phospholipid/cholesterol/gamma-HCH transport system substrate-binding protein
MNGVERREIVVGIAAIFALMAVLAYAYADRDRGGVGASDYRVRATFNRVDGLQVGSDVTVSGIAIGDVERLDLDPNFRALVTLRLKRSVPLPVDTSAAVHTDGLFGSKFIVLEPGGEEELLEEGDLITFTQDSVIVSELLDLIIAEGKAVRSTSAKVTGEDKP